MHRPILQTFRPRVIPVLLLRGKGLVKSVKFKDHRYIGDPINAVKIFNDLKADELVFLDINASREKRAISLDFVKNVGEEANMPFSVGGGITKLNEIQDILSAGAEKVVINTYAIKKPEFIKIASDNFGSSTITVCIDVKRSFWGREKIWIMNSQKSTSFSPVDYAKLMEDKGAGELIIQCVDSDGTMKGYNIELIKKISQNVRIPVVALGGAGNFNDMKEAFKNGFANALAAGSMFLYHGRRNGILINYLQKTEIFDN